MDGIAVNANRGDDHFAEVVPQNPRLGLGHGSALDCLFEGITRVVDPEGDVPHTIAVFPDVVGNLALRT